MKVNKVSAHGMSSIKEQGDLFWTPAHQSSYSEWNADKNWSSQEWKSDELMEVRTGRPVHEQPPSLSTEHTDRFLVDDDDMDSNTVTESELAFKSRTFLHKVNDRVRQMLDKTSKDPTKDSNKHSLIWRMLMTSTLEASVFMGKNYSQNLRCIKNTSNNLTMKQMFDISEKLTVGQSDEIYGVTPINWDDSSWKHLSLMGDEEVISLSHAKVSQWNSSGIFPRIHHIAVLQQSPRVPVKNEWSARIIYRTDHLYDDVQRHLMVISRQWSGMRIKRPTRFYLCEKIFTRKMVLPRTWIRKEVVFHSW